MLLTDVYQSFCFVVVDVHNQLPLLGRNWWTLLQFDMGTLINQAAQIHHMSEVTLTIEILTKFLMILKINYVSLSKVKQILQR